MSRPRDLWDGKPLLKHWSVVRGEECPETHNGRKVLRSWLQVSKFGIHHRVWTGLYQGYGDAEYQRVGERPLFRSLKNALLFAEAAFKAGYRRKP